MKKTMPILAILIFAYTSIYSQKTYTYFESSYDYTVYANGVQVRKVTKTTSEKFGNFDASGNLYTYLPASGYTSVKKNGVFLNYLKAGKYGNCINDVLLYSYDTVRGVRDTLRLKLFKNGILSKTIIIANNEKYGETDSYGNIYTYINTYGLLTVKKNGSAYKSISRMGDFGSADDSGNIFTWVRNTDGSFTVNKNGVFYYKSASVSTQLFGDCR